MPHAGATHVTRDARWTLLAVGMQRWEIAVDADVGMAHAGPVAGTGPEPVGRTGDQTPADGIVVNVLDRLVDGFQVIEITIMARTRLPESMIGPTRVSHG